MPNLKICAVTSSRADYNYLAPVMTLLRDDPAFCLQILVTGQHLKAEGEVGLRQIREDGFATSAAVDIDLTDDTPRGVANSLGKAVTGLAGAFDDLRPDLLMILGDRYETLAAAQVSMLFGIPVAHIGGGDVTEGAFDDAIRHSISKMSHLHFVSHDKARKRLIAMGEQPSRVFAVGSPTIDWLRGVQLMERQELLSELNIRDDGLLFLITFHPPTLSDDGLAECREMIAALEHFSDSATFLFTGVNADPGNRSISEEIKAFCAVHDNAYFFDSLGSRRYFSALANSDAVIGNSSSGLYEAPSLGIPTVNIGMRQHGRVRAQSVVDSQPRRGDIIAAIHRALALECREVINPYGDGRAAQRIVAVLKNLENPRHLLRKAFYET